MIDPLSTVDVVEIEQLMARIAATADLAIELQDYLDNLTEDVVFEFAAVPAVGLDAHSYAGHAAVLAGVEERRASGVQGPGSRAIHVVADVVVTAEGTESARVHAAWQYYGFVDERPAILAMGFYDNAVRKVDGRWLLSRRRVTVL